MNRKHREFKQWKIFNGVARCYCYLLILVVLLPRAFWWFVLTFDPAETGKTYESFSIGYRLTDFLFPIADDGNIDILSLLFYLLMIWGWLYAAQPYSMGRRKLGVSIGIPMTILFFLSSSFIIFIQAMFGVFGI